MCIHNTRITNPIIGQCVREVFNHHHNKQNRLKMMNVKEKKCDRQNDLTSYYLLPISLKTFSGSVGFCTHLWSQTHTRAQTLTIQNSIRT